MNSKSFVTRARVFVTEEMKHPDPAYRIKVVESLLVLNPQQRKVFLQRFANRSFGRIAERFGLSRERVKQHEYKSIKKMKAYLCQTN